MKIARSVAVALFTALKFKTAPKWDDEKLVAKLNGMADVVAEGVPDGVDDAQKKLIEKIVKAAAAEVEFELTDDQDAAETPAAKPTKGKAKPAAEEEEAPAAKPAKAKGKAKPAAEEEEAPAAAKPKAKPAKPAKAEKAPKAEKAKVEKDKFGSREGSNAAKINAAITAKPQTMTQLLEKAGLEQTMYNHLNRLVEAGHVVKSDEGYALAPKK